MKASVIMRVAKLNYSSNHDRDAWDRLDGSWKVRKSFQGATLANLNALSYNMAL
jgi:hypothetical protein